MKGRILLMKKQLTALVLCICMVLSVLPFTGTQTAQAAAEETSSVGTSNISIGDGSTAGQEWGVPLNQTIQLHLGPNYSSSKKYEHTTIPIQVIQKTRSDNENMVVVICGEGYTKGDLLFTI